MEIRPFDSTPAFVALDLPDAEIALAACRLAPKILRDGAELLARSLTYGFASLEMRSSGASVGIDASAEARADALAAFVRAAEPEVAAGRLLLDAARGVSESDLAPLRSVDPRPAALWGLASGHRVSDLLVADGVAASAHVALGGLEGRTVAIEVASPAAVAVIDRLLAVGAIVVAVGGGSGAVRCATDGGSSLRAALDAGAGVALADSLGGSTPVGSLLEVEADVLLVGSRAGIVDHDVASSVAATTIVPVGPVPVTARGLAVLRRRGVAVLPDFIATAGALTAVGAAPGATVEELRTAAAVAVGGAMSEVVAHPDGALLGACARAEAFLATWQDDLPFGRPLA